jgi:NADH-ubiquinone oxidoreductase chain 5
LVYLTFFGEPAGSRSVVRLVHEPDNKMTVPLIVLGLFSIFVGYTLKDFYIGLGSDFLSSGLHEQNVKFCFVTYA